MKTVLFVDDEIMVLKSIRRSLDDSGYNILFAASGSEALHQMEANEVHVIVSDNNMPGMLGVELLERAKILYPDTIRVMLTANIEFNTALEAINRSEAFRFVTKPWSDETLHAAVREAFQQHDLMCAMKSGDEAQYLALAKAVELKDPYTSGHCERVAEYALGIAVMLDFSDDDLNSIRHGCILHDCGKIGVPEAILNFPGRLSASDLEVVTKHPVWGCEVAAKAKLPKIVQNIILYHHEKYDGKGYPHRLSGEAIPLESRVAAIADVYDALTSDRPYRKGYEVGEAFRIMTIEMAGHFDPALLSIFMNHDGLSA